ASPVAAARNHPICHGTIRPTPPAIRGSARESPRSPRAVRARCRPRSGTLSADGRPGFGRSRTGSLFSVSSFFRSWYLPVIATILLLLEQRIHVRRGIERDQVIRPLPHPDELHRDVELAHDREDHAAFGRAVEFGHHHAGDFRGVEEGGGLADAVLTGGAVDDEQGLVGRAGHFFFHHAADLRQ